MFFDRAGGSAAMLDGTPLEVALDGPGLRFRLAPGAGWPALELLASSRLPTRFKNKWQVLYRIDGARLS